MLMSNGFGATEVIGVTSAYRRVQGAILVRIANRRRLIHVPDGTLRVRSHMYTVIAIAFAALLVGTAPEQAFRLLW